jgi:hypothetical protein
MKPYIASITIPGKSKAHVALIPSTFRLIVHSPADSDKVCVGFNDKTGTLIYITLYPNTDDSREYLRDMSEEYRKRISRKLCDEILFEITKLITTGINWHGERIPVRTLVLDDWRYHWEDCLDTIILEILKD